MSEDGARRWCDGCGSIVADDGLPCERCERWAEEQAEDATARR